jgi:hypothetical protein
MKTVEDLLELLQKCMHNPAVIKTATGVKRLEISVPWDRKFIDDLSHKTLNGNSLSTKQGEVVLKLVKKYREGLVVHGIDDAVISALLVSPVYRNTPYQSKELPREVRFAGERKLLFRSKFNPVIVEDIKKLKPNKEWLGRNFPYFNRAQSVWVVEVTDSNLERVMNTIKKHNFLFDEEVEQFLLACENAKGAQSRADLVDGVLRVTVMDDELFNFWLQTDLKISEAQNV